MRSLGDESGEAGRLVARYDAAFTCAKVGEDEGEAVTYDVALWLVAKGDIVGVCGLRMGPRREGEEGE